MTRDQHIQPRRRHDAPQRSRQHVVYSPLLNAARATVVLAIVVAWIIGNPLVPAGILCECIAFLLGQPHLFDAGSLAWIDRRAHRRARKRRGRRARRREFYERFLLETARVPGLCFIFGVAGFLTSVVLFIGGAEELAGRVAGVGALAAVLALLLQPVVALALALFAQSKGDVATGPLVLLKAAAFGQWLKAQTWRHGAVLGFGVSGFVLALLGLLIS